VLDDRARTLAAWSDRALLDWSRAGLGNHLRDGGAFDDEGVLSTLPAIATAMLGVLAGRWIDGTEPLSVRIKGLFAAGALAIVAGLLWGWTFPINKKLWTSSFVLFTAGAASVALASVLWLVDVRGWRRWTRPAVIYGTNPLVAFAGSEVLAFILHSTIKVKVDGRRIGLTEWIYRAFDAVLAPRDASLAYALCFVAAWYGILLVLYRRRIFVRI
jgi:predicted acyltransferase